MSWLREMLTHCEHQESFVLVTVVEVIGSAPREVGARMLVTANSLTDTIGGGNLEHEAMSQARKMLTGQITPNRRLEFFGLGVMMNQCCGGAVRLLFEMVTPENSKALYNRLYHVGRKRIEFLVSSLAEDGTTVVLSTKHDWETVPAAVEAQTLRLLESSEPSSTLFSDESGEWFLTRIDDRPTKVVLFGAGHVGKALIKLLEDLPFQIDWVDSRKDMFPTEIPLNTVVHSLSDPLSFVSDQASRTFYVVMTHSHGLDYEICSKILRERDFGWLGLIGSNTKAQRFKNRMIDDGIDAFTLNRLNCPIGIEGVRGKFPAVIALSTAAQLLQERQNRLSDRKPSTGVVGRVHSTTG